MSTEHEFVELIGSIMGTLTAFAARMRARLPTAMGAAGSVDRMSPFVSFAATTSSETVDLCINLKRVGASVECRADLSSCGYEDFLSVMPTLVLSDSRDDVQSSRFLS